MPKTVYYVASISLAVALGVYVFISGNQSSSGLISQKSAMLSSGDARKNYLKNELNEWNAFIIDTATKEYKYDAMNDPFTFYRATAHLYFSDLKNGMIEIPSEWKSTSQIDTWIQGDMHTQNFGFYEDKDGDMVFGINDFDESHIAPFYWDLIRYGASIYLMRDGVEFNFSQDEANEMVDYFLEKYQETLSDVNGNPFETEIVLKTSQTDGFVNDTMEDNEDKKTAQKLYDKWTKIENDVRKFDISLEKLEAPSDTFKYYINQTWGDYTNTVKNNTSDMGYYAIKDIAKRLYSGLGSQGMQKYYVLIEGESDAQDDDVILEIKQQGLPSLFKAKDGSYDPIFSHHGERTFTATKAMLNDVEGHLGYLNIDNIPFSVKTISKYKDGYDIDQFESESDLKNFVKHCAKALAYSHARADKDYKNGEYINYNFEDNALQAIDDWSKAKTTMRELSEEYAEQVEIDFTFFQELKAENELY